MNKSFEPTPAALPAQTSAAPILEGRKKRTARFARQNRLANGPAEMDDLSIDARYPHSVAYADVETDLDALIDKAASAIAEGEPMEDAILGRYVSIASLVRSIAIREGKLLEHAVERLAKVNPDLTVLTQSLRLPMVKAAVETVTSNKWESLEGITIDCEAPAKGTYTPDLIIVNRAKHLAYVLDLKRSLASYGDTNRLDDLRIRMMASALVLPDWLYKNHKRLMVDTVGVAIIDGASRPSDHSTGIWALDEIDDLLEIDGAAACMAELRLRFGESVRGLLEIEARKAADIHVEPGASGTDIEPVKSEPIIHLNSIVLHDEPDGFWPEDECFDIPDCPEGAEACTLGAVDEDGPILPFRIKVGFAYKPKIH